MVGDFGEVSGFQHTHGLPAGIASSGRSGDCQFLSDPDPLLVVEAARAINDAPIDNAMPALAKWLAEGAVLPNSDLTASLSEKDYADLVLRPVLRRALNASFRVGGQRQRRVAVSVRARPRNP